MSHMTNNKNKRHLFDGMKAPVDEKALWDKLVARPDFPHKEKRKRRYIFFFITLGFVLGAFLVHYGHEWEQSQHEEVEHPATQPTLKGSAEKPLDRESKQIPTVESTQNDDKIIEDVKSEKMEKAEHNSTLIQNNSLRINTMTHPTLPHMPLNDIPTLPSGQPQIENEINLEQKFNEYEKETPVDLLELFASIDEPSTTFRTDKVALVKRLPQHLPFIFSDKEEVTNGDLPMLKKNGRTHHSAGRWIVLASAKTGYDNWDISSPSSSLSFAENLSTNKLESSARGISVIGAQIELRREVGRWFAGAGIEMTRRTQRLKQINEMVTYSILNNTPDALFSRSVVTTQIVNKNTYDFLDVAVYAGHTFRLGSWLLRPSVGIGKNIRLTSTGKVSTVTSVDNDVRRFVKKEEVQKVFAIGRLQFEKPLSHKTNIMMGLETTSRRTLQRDDQEFSHSYVPIGLALGLTRRL